MATLLASAQRFSENVKAHQLALIESPQKTAEANLEMFRATRDSLAALATEWAQLTEAAPQMSTIDARNLFFALFDRVIYSDSFGANLYWVSKAAPGSIDIAKLDTQLEHLVSALATRLKADETDEATHLVTELATDFVIEDFSHARLPYRMATVDEFLAIRRLKRDLTPQEKAVSKYYSWVSERKVKKDKIEELHEIWEDSPRAQAPGNAAPPSAPPPPKAQPAPPPAAPKVPTTSLLNDLPGVEDVGADDTRRGPIQSGNTSRDERKLPEHMQRKADREATVNADRLARMNAVRVNQGMKPLSSLPKEPKR